MRPSLKSVTILSFPFEISPSFFKRSTTTSFASNSISITQRFSLQLIMSISVSHSYGCDELNCFLLGNVFWYDQNLKGSIVVHWYPSQIYQNSRKRQGLKIKCKRKRRAHMLIGTHMHYKSLTMCIDRQIFNLTGEKRILQRIKQRI